MGPMLNPRAAVFASIPSRRRFPESLNVEPRLAELHYVHASYPQILVIGLFNPSLYYVILISGSRQSSDLARRK